MPLHSLVFTSQPPKTVISGQTFGHIQVAALNAAGENASPRVEAITISLEDCPNVKEAKASGLPKRLRAKAAGCADGVSDVFYIVPS